MVRRSSATAGLYKRRKKTRSRTNTWPRSEQIRHKECTNREGLVPNNGYASAVKGFDHQIEEKVTFFASPFKVSYYSTLYLKGQLYNIAGYIIQYPLTLSYSTALGLIYTGLHFISGPHIELLQDIDIWTAWYLYWVILGILSSVGLGAGLHTFVLFLGPHIARVTLTTYECGNTSFSVNGPNAFQCATNENKSIATITFAGIIQKVISESLCWGAGTAIGELPPYFIARAASAAGQGDVEYDRLRRKASSRVTLTLKDRALLSVYSLLKSFGFTGILIFAAIPNPLFDLAGITCGHFQVPFWTFFGATFIGKSLIKSTLQTIVVVTAFSKDIIVMVLSFLRNINPWAHDLAERILHNQTVVFGGSTPYGNTADGDLDSGTLLDKINPSSSDNTSRSLSLIGSLWNACVAIMLFYFCITALESFAQSYLAEVKSWGQNQLARVGSRQKNQQTMYSETPEDNSLSSTEIGCGSNVETATKPATSE